ncbi:MAG: LD-carboxypeptidase [Vicinamibacterales bacterium]
MIRPPALRKGSRVALVSPASPFDRDEFEKGCQELRRLGFEPVYHDTVFDKGPFSSGPPELRAASFVRAWSDPSVDALMAVRGGWGSMQLLPELAGWEPQHRPRLFIGYSDNTSLLSWLTCHCGVTAVHGPMIDGRLARGTEAYDEASFLSVVTGDCVGRILSPAGVTVLRDGEVAGPLFGGTLSLLSASQGTPCAFTPPQGCVLFLEDVNERPYRIERMLAQLQQAGVLDRAAAIVFGEMKGCREGEEGLTAHFVAEQLAAEFDGPVLYGFPSGHTAGPMWTLPLGVRVRVRASNEPALVIEESPVV